MRCPPCTVVPFCHPGARAASRSVSLQPGAKPFRGSKAAPEDGPSDASALEGLGGVEGVGVVEAASALEEGLLPSPGPSSNSSEHDWPQHAGRHAGETKRVCTICLVSGRWGINTSDSFLVQSISSSAKGCPANALSMIGYSTRGSRRARSSACAPFA